jgi:hypothetical protein
MLTLFCGKKTSRVGPLRVSNREDFQGPLIYDCFQDEEQNIATPFDDSSIYGLIPK